jgi:hypothetical protein
MRREYLAVPMVGTAVGYGLLIYWAATSGSAIAWMTLVLVSVALAVVFAVAVSRRDSRFEELTLVHPPRPEDDVYRVLVVVDAGGTSAAFREALLDAAAGRPTEALVIAPALSSGLDRLTGDQAAYDEASTRLHETIGGLDAIGVEARGRIGSHDPLQALAEGLREFPADWIVFTTDSGEKPGSLENGVVAATRSRTEIPVTAVVVDRVSAP